MSFYPTAVDAKTAEPVLSYAVEAPKVIALLNSGCPQDYKCKDLAPGDPIPVPHICGIVLAGRDAPRGMKAIYDRVMAEQKKLAEVKITKDMTQTAYLAELDKVAEAASSALWLAGLKEANAVTTWTDLRDKLAPVEAVEK